MKIDRISMRFGLTINTGNYESARVDVGAEARVEEVDDPFECYKQVEDIATEELQRQIKGIKSAAAERMKR
jgi:hypothetical protein